MRFGWLLVLGGLALLDRGAAAQCGTQKLVPSDTANGDQFGCGVGISGDWAVIGAFGEDDVLQQSGAAYFYQRRGTGWIEAQRVKASPVVQNMVFGWSAAIDGEFAVIGAPGANAGGMQFAGAAYVFHLSGGTWTQVAKLVASNAAASAKLGRSVAISGLRVLVGTEQADHAGNQSGAAYVFEQVNGTWVQVQELVASDTQGAQWFGFDLDIEGDIAVVGAPTVSSPGIATHGAAYVFERQGTSWIERQKLMASDKAASDVFGWSVGCTSTTVLAGAINHDAFGSNAGAVYAFDRQGVVWQEVQKIHAADATGGDQFGEKLRVVDDWLLVSSTGDDDTANATGSVYSFRRDALGWIQALKLMAADGSAGDAFGLALAIDPQAALVGVMFDDEACPGDVVCNSGSAYALVRPQGATQFGSCHAGGTACFNPDDHGGCSNSTGRGAVLSACGTGSVLADDLVLEARDLPPSVFGIFFMGAEQTSAPLGDGLRVVGPGGAGLFRFPAQQVTADGVLLRGPGIVAASQAFPNAGQIQPGSTWNFQLWYRDVQGPCGTFTNASNGLEVVFEP